MAWKVTSLDSPEPISIVCAGGEKAYSYTQKKKWLAKSGSWK